MQKKQSKQMHWILLAFLPFLAGCETGLTSLFGLVNVNDLLGFSGSDFGFLGGGGGGGGSLLSSGGGDTIALVHNPEPASMFLLGGGMAAMAYLKRKNKKK